ncbi:PP2C family protein-serine/threonine phosphatase [Streptomyces sp. NPDC004044]
MRAIAAHEPDPATVLTRTNELLVTMDAARFASCTMLHIDPGDGRVTGTSAGHVPLLYARGDGSHSIRELPGGPVLGVLPDADYSEETFSPMSTKTPIVPGLGTWTTLPEKRCPKCSRRRVSSHSCMLTTRASSQGMSPYGAAFSWPISCRRARSPSVARGMPAWPCRPAVRRSLSGGSWPWLRGVHTR